MVIFGNSENKQYFWNCLMSKTISILILLVTLLSSCIKEKSSGADLVVGDMVPDFTVVTDDGTSLTGEQLSQGASCIVFFTTVCPDCQNALPHIQRLYDEYAPQGVQFVLISREEGADTIARYWEEHQLTMPYSAQTDRKIYELFAKTRVPRIYICGSGVIKAIFTDTPPPVYEDVADILKNI